MPRALRFQDDRVAIADPLRSTALVQSERYAERAILKIASIVPMRTSRAVGSVWVGTLIQEAAGPGSDADLGGGYHQDRVAGSQTKWAWSDNPSILSRYVFFNSNARDAKVPTAAKKTARSRGATVVKSLTRTMLLEGAPAQVPEVEQALPGWPYAAERKTTRVPECKALERSKVRGALAAAAKARSLAPGVGIPGLVAVI